MPLQLRVANYDEVKEKPCSQVAARYLRDPHFHRPFLASWWESQAVKRTHKSHCSELTCEQNGIDKERTKQNTKALHLLVFPSCQFLFPGIFAQHLASRMAYPTRKEAGISSNQ